MNSGYEVYAFVSRRPLPWASLPLRLPPAHPLSSSLLARTRGPVTPRGQGSGRGRPTIRRGHPCEYGCMTLLQVIHERRPGVRLLTSRLLFQAESSRGQLGGSAYLNQILNDYSFPFLYSYLFIYFSRIAICVLFLQNIFLLFL